jgi:hypothetical protein
MADTLARRYPKDNLGRRIRGRRTPSGKRLVLQRRDIEILKLLRRYRFLRSPFIWKLLPPEYRGKSFKRFQDRLTDLFHETDTPHGGAYLNWPQQQREAYNARYTASIYALSPAGETLLEDAGIAPGNVTDLVCSGRMAANREFPHAMMICDTLASMELGTRSEPNIRLVSWQEIMAKAPLRTRQADNPFAIPVEISHQFSNANARAYEKFRLVPDGLFGLEYKHPAGKKLYRFFALEAERRNRVSTGSLKGTSFLKKVLAYRAIIDKATHRTHFGIPNLVILTVAPTQARIETMMKTIFDLYGAAGSASFLFRCICTQGYGDQIEPPTGHMFHEPWQRAGSNEFRLNDQQAR